MSHLIVPDEPTPAMLLAYHRALKDYIESVPPAERDKRWRTVRKRGGITGYLIPKDEKAIVRYRAMVRVGNLNARADALVKNLEGAAI